MLTHTYDASHEHIHNDEPTWCFDHGYYVIIIINLLLTVIYIVLNSLAFQPLSDFRVVPIILLYYLYIFKFRVPFVWCGIETSRFDVGSNKTIWYIIFVDGLVLYGLLR